jgi:hypothetical protein
VHSTRLLRQASVIRCGVPSLDVGQLFNLNKPLSLEKDFTAVVVVIGGQ